jgi:hypothetical protein
MWMQLDGTIGRAVAEYIGGSVLELDVVPDPGVKGVYAIQALVKPNDGNAFQVQFLLSGVSLKTVVAGDLEEVEFTSWPPTSRS